MDVERMKPWSWSRSRNL